MKRLAISKNLTSRLALGLLVPALLAPALSGCGSSSQAPTETSKPGATAPALRTSAALQLTEASSIADVVEAVLPSVVSITSTRTAKPNPGHFFFGGSPQPQKQQGLGSGVILTADGIIITNNHVIEGAEEVMVRTFDDHDYEAKVVGTDPKTDIAVLQLVGQVQGLRPAAVGDSSHLRLGEVVLAIGNPFGVGQTVTMGIVSAQGRADMGIVDYEDFIQTDAAINPGNSGGALVNTRGELVGINTAILSRSGGSMGIGFAIPTNMAGPIVDALRTQGRVTRGWLGVSLQEMNSDLGEALGSNTGVLIADVQKGGPGDRSGLESGDVVVQVNERDVHSTGQFRNVIAGAGANKTVKMTVMRDGKKVQLDVKLGELPGEDKAATKVPTSAAPGEPEVGGITLQAINPDIRRRLRLPDDVSGVVVARVDPGSTASDAGLRVGDVILEVNKVAVRSTAEVDKLYRAAAGTKLLLVYRQGTRVYVAVK